MSQSYEQVPRLDKEPGQEALVDIRRWIIAILKYLTRQRRQLVQSVPSFRSGSATYDPPNLNDGAGATTTVTVSGAALGDLAFASFSLDLQGITVTPYVSAASTVSVRFQNESGGAVDLAEGTLRAWSMYPPEVTK